MTGRRRLIEGECHLEEVSEHSRREKNVRWAGTNYSAYAPDLPGSVTTGRELEETKRRMGESVLTNSGTGLVVAYRPTYPFSAAPVSVNRSAFQRGTLAFPDRANLVYLCVGAGSYCNSTWLPTARRDWLQSLTTGAPAGGRMHLDRVRLVDQAPRVPGMPRLATGFVSARGTLAFRNRLPVPSRECSACPHGHVA